MQRRLSGLSAGFEVGTGSRCRHLPLMQKEAFPANNQLLTGEALAGAATRHSSKRPMWFHLRLNPFIADRFKIRIPDKGPGKEGSERSHMCHMCRDRIEERQGPAEVLPAGRHRQGGRLWEGSISSQEHQGVVKSEKRFPSERGCRQITGGRLQAELTFEFDVTDNATSFCYTLVTHKYLDII